METIEAEINGNLQIILLAIAAWITIWLLLHFASKDTPVYCLFITFISWFFCFSTYVILTIDIYLAIKHPNIDHNSTIETIWLVLYWGNFTNTWYLIRKITLKKLRVILPLFMEYEESGEFDKCSRLKRSLWINLLYIAAYIIIAGQVMIIFTIFCEDITK